MGLVAPIASVAAFPDNRRDDHKPTDGADPGDIPESLLVTVTLPYRVGIATRLLCPASSAT
jgi:hypothetical protein